MPLSPDAAFLSRYLFLEMTVCLTRKGLQSFLDEVRHSCPGCNTLMGRDEGKSARRPDESSDHILRYELAIVPCGWKMVVLYMFLHTIFVFILPITIFSSVNFVLHNIIWHNKNNMYFLYKYLYHHIFLCNIQMLTNMLCNKAGC